MRIKELCEKYDKAHECYRKAASTDVSVESSKDMQEAREAIEGEIKFAMSKLGGRVNNHPLEVVSYFNTWFILRKGWA